MISPAIPRFIDMREDDDVVARFFAASALDKLAEHGE
jgi:hypothetical protein